MTATSQKVVYISTPQLPIERQKERYEVGEKVLFRVQFNDPGHMNPDERISGVVICRFEGRTQPLTYRIELDRVWSNRLPQCEGKKIVVGNVSSNFISLIEE